jgi:ELWxxDGT repeat protein
MALSINRSVRNLTIAAAVGTIGLSAIARGDATGPYLLGDTIPSTASGFTTSTAIVTSGTTAYLRLSNNALWRTDGRPGGTSQVDINLTTAPVAVPAGGVVYLRTNATGGPSLQFVGQTGTPIVIGQTAYSIQNAHGTVPAITVGSKVLYSIGGTHLMSWDSITGASEDLGTGFLPTATSDVLVLGSRAFSIGLSTSAPVVLNQTDGTLAGTSTVATFAASFTNGSGTILQNGGSVACFALRDSASNQTMMYASDGTPAGTRALGTMPNFTIQGMAMWSTPGAMGIYATGLVGSRAQLWHFGATPADTGMLLDFPNTTRFVNVSSAGGMNVFVDTGTTYGPAATARLWVTNGQPGQTLIGPPVAVTQDSTLASPNVPGGAIGVTSGNEVYFLGTTTANGAEPWHVNLATAALGMVADLSPGPQASSGERMFPLGYGGGLGVLTMVNFNTATGTTPGIWFLNTSGAPQRFIPAPGLSNGVTPVAIGNRVIFGLTTSTTGMEPYAIDLCPADYDNNGALDSSDIFAFLNDWLASSPNADFDKSGGTPSMNDLFGYLNAWIAGCQ